MFGLPGDRAGRSRAVIVPQMLHVRDEKSAGTSGGTGSAAAWNTRTLNTVKTNEIPDATLASNQLKLPPGTYVINAVAPAYKVNQNKLRLRSITDSADILYGQSQYFDQGAVNSLATLNGIFVLSQTTVIELQHYITNSASGASEAMGVAVSASSTVEVYAEITLEKLR